MMSSESLAAMRAAQQTWAARNVEDRCQWLEAARQRMFAQRAALAEVVSAESGKPMAEALIADVATTLDVMQWLARVAPTVLGERRLRPGAPALWRKRVTIRQVPFGIVGVISPWNYPVLLVISHVAAALVAGNAVLLKPSELTPRTADLLVSLLNGPELPTGLLQVLHGGPEAGRTVLDHADKVCFTGSERVGRLVAAHCASRLIPCVLELGGSDAAIVCEDADIDLAARGIVWGRFANAGQTCVAPKRVFAVGKAWDALVPALQREIGSLSLTGPDRDMSPLASPAFGAELQRMVDAATLSGARVIRAPNVPENVFPPTLVLDPPADSPVLVEETFGPVLAIVPVDSDDAAVRAANASRYQLSASVWSASRTHGVSIAGQLAAGTVTINDVASATGMAEVPHGGSGASGYGRSHGVVGLEEFVRTHSIVDDILPRRGQPWWFPYAGLYSSLDEYVQYSQGRGLLNRLRGLRGSLALLFRR